VAEAATRLGLSRICSAGAAELSGGQRQRTALARAIVRAPAVSSSTSPSRTSTPTSASSCAPCWLALHRALRATMVYVTHDQVDAMTMGTGSPCCTRDGAPVGSPAEVYQRPADVFVARSLGTPAMNVLAGRARGTAEGGDERMFESGSLRVPVALPTYEGEVQIGVRPEHIGVSGVTRARQRGRPQRRATRQRKRSYT